MRQKLVIAAMLFTPLGVTAQEVAQGEANADFAPAFENQTRAPALPTTAVATEVFVDGLSHPWGIATLPGGGWLVTERPGRMRVITPDGRMSIPVEGLPEVDDRRQGGLLDVAVSPDFAEDRTVFWTYAKRVPGGTVTAATRGVISGDFTRMTEVQDIFVQEPPSRHPMHYGSRILPQADGTVWITTGEHSAADERDRAQEIDTTYGKVVRVTRDGDPAPGNPYIGRDGIDTIWSLGHRNMQGAAVHPVDGALWTVEHGPRGGDELNRPEPGGNYGWPVVSYGIEYRGSDVGSGQARAPGFEEPVYYWDPVIAPGGMIFHSGNGFDDWAGDLLIGSLNPGGLVRLELNGDRVAGEERLVPELGRVRDVEELADGSLLLLIDAPEPFGEIVRMTAR
ncbi:PQQ-dependent sugar dehydrogenase [Alexandriicola marinus]|uniref:PQQ-dependent sugar dehydrogenase n=1 Tax=Alexandriicola marinus TaxID=2081710 RepID=UPI000FD98BF2|nr:PQQ-dependent sugar dehydrogenase [Alexandriicola marinus]